jgi:hypothetical protein
LKNTLRERHGHCGATGASRSDARSGFVEQFRQAATEARDRRNSGDAIRRDAKRYCSQISQPQARPTPIVWRQEISRRSTTRSRCSEEELTVPELRSSLLHSGMPLGVGFVAAIVLLGIAGIGASSGKGRRNFLLCGGLVAGIVSAASGCRGGGGASSMPPAQVARRRS